PRLSRIEGVSIQEGERVRHVLRSGVFAVRCAPWHAVALAAGPEGPAACDQATRTDAGCSGATELLGDRAGASLPFRRTRNISTSTTATAASTHQIQLLARPLTTSMSATVASSGPLPARAALPID